MYGRRVVTLDTQLRTEVPKCVIVELLSIVGDKHFGYPVPADDIPPNKTPNVLLRDSG